MSAPEAVNRQLVKGEKNDSSIEDDADRIAQAVVRHWGVHAAEVLRRAAQIAEEMEGR